MLHYLLIGSLALASPETPVRGQAPSILDAQVAPAFLMRSRSLAIGHAFKPMVRVGLRWPVLTRIEVGGALLGLLDASEHYRVLGALAQGRLALWHRPRFSAGAGLGLGVGYNADILHEDLAARAPVVPYGSAALDARWRLGHRWLLGVEAGWDNLSIARLGLLIGFQIDHRSDAGRGGQP